MQFGQTLKAAREAKGLTVGQLAETTHIMVQIVEDMENDNFARIAAPIYGRGFIKRYCSVVGIDPAPFINEYMSIINGDHDAPIRRIEPSAKEPPLPSFLGGNPPTAEATAPAAPAPAPMPAAEPVQHIVQPAFDDPLPPPAAEAQPKPEPQPHAVAPLSRYASPLGERHVDRPRATKFQLPKLPPSFFRMALLVGGMLAVILILFFSIRALYRMTMSSPAKTETPSAEVAAQEPKAEKPAAPKPTAEKPRSAAPIAPVKTTRKPRSFYFD